MTTELAKLSLEQALRYVAYQRLPLGNTVFDTLPEEWQRIVTELLAPAKDRLRPETKRECAHLLRVAEQVKHFTIGHMAALNALPPDLKARFLATETECSFSGYTQGLWRAAGELVRLRGESLAELEKLAEEIEAELHDITRPPH